MAKERSILKTLIVNFWNSIKPRRNWGNRVGTDYNGTHYYEIPIEEFSQKRRPSRWFVPQIKGNFQQEIPPEWESWLRHRRKDPPAEEEIQANLAKMAETKRKAAELEKEYTKSLEGDVSRPIVITSKNFPVYDDLEGMPGGSIKGNRFESK